MAEVVCHLLVCLICKKYGMEQYNFGCKELSGFKYKCDFVRDVPFDLFIRKGVLVKKETLVNFFTERSTLKYVNVMSYKLVGEKYTCVDLTGVSQLVKLRIETFTVGQTTLKTMSSKVVKHEKICSNNQHVFVLFAFDTFDVQFQRLLSFYVVMYNNVKSSRYMNVVSTRNNFAIQKGLVMLFVARLSSIQL
ncbi:hypothetical protein MtrunA17_Chr3g0118311 [Medicago truncatula]|uniref:Uncharacterized protein n=1 Tax=Medicago truncatula TaxID=3880 RepID=A0A396ITW7_MEDTR|nr:hypothetical protein MtrunA17_Chr3g0118311 [Medicago truncatula]